MTALYYRDKDSGEYKKLGYGKIEEIGEILADDVDVVDERIERFFINRNETITLTIKQPKIIDTTAREIEEGDKIRGLRTSTTVIEEYPFSEEEECINLTTL